MKKSLIVITVLLICSFICSAGIYAATSGSYEYNDYNLYSITNTYYTSGAFRSNQGGPMTSFVIGVNVNTNQWWITGGEWTNIPFPVGITIDYTDKTSFLTTAYITVNGNNYNFTTVSGDDDSGIFYSRSVEASPYYPTVSVYLPTTGSAVNVPETPILAYSNGTITWNNPNYYTTEIYMSESSNLAGDLQGTVTGTSYKIREDKDGYYYVRIRYTVNGQYRYTDNSNRVYASYVAGEDEGEQELEWWAKILKFFSDISNGFRNALSTVGQFITDIGIFIRQLVSWLPEEVSSVFYAVVIIGLVLGLFLK